MLPATVRDILYGFGRPGQLALHALYSPPDVVIRKGGRFIFREMKNRLRCRQEWRRCPYPPRDESIGGLTSRLRPLSLANLDSISPELQALVPLYLTHHQDLLGSGWVRIAHGEAYAGFSGHRYGPFPALSSDRWKIELADQLPIGCRKRCLDLLGMIDDSSYRPIDWHVDFKSGYRWDPAHWGRSISVDGKAGVDFKVPLELARMQHLPHLALAYMAGGNDSLPKEFRSQLLDFLGTNPPGWGINWLLAMDVAIRAANILVAHDLFCASGVIFDQVFEAELVAAMLAHGRYIVEFLEWYDDPRANHYLCDIAGLAFIAAYLPRSSETDVWLAFAVRQLETEIDRQFTDDGAHFEASTSYHCLAAETALYAVALVLGLSADKRSALSEYDHRCWRREPALASAPVHWPPFSPTVLSKLARAAHFASNVTKPSGDMVQIGDGDSGRFLKLSPNFELIAGIRRERHLDTSPLIAAANGVFDTGLPGPAVGDVETEVVSVLAGAVRPSVHGLRAAISIRDHPDEEAAARSVTRVILQPPQPNAFEQLASLAYPDFGLFIWRNSRTFISIRCGPIGRNGNHAHNDQLAVEIEIHGVAWAQDPGTYVYRPDFAARNQYRSALAHFVPRNGRSEPADLIAHFRLEDRAQARVFRFGPDGFLGMHQGFGFPVFRSVGVTGHGITIDDSVCGSRITANTLIVEHLIHSPQELRELWQLRLPFSPGYGLRAAE